MKRREPILIVLVLLPVLAGCWDSQDIEGLAFPLVASYDVHRSHSADVTDPANNGEKELVDVTTLIPNLVPEAKEPVEIETLSGVTVADTRGKRGLTDPDIYVIGINRIIIVGEELARQGVNPYIDSLWRNPKIATTMYMAVGAGRGEDIIKTPITNYKHMGTYLIALFDGIEQRTFVPVSNLAQFFTHLAKGKNPVLPLLERKGKSVIISGTAIFRKDRMIAKLGVEDTLTLVLLRGKGERGYLSFKSASGGWGTVLVSNSRKVQYRKSDEGHSFIITVKLKGTMEEHMHQKRIDEKHLAMAEKVIEKQVTANCCEFVEMMQNEIKVDCIDISKYALAKERRNLEKTIDHPEFIRNANIQVKVEVDLKNAGEMF